MFAVLFLTGVFVSNISGFPLIKLARVLLNKAGPLKIEFCNLREVRDYHVYSSFLRCSLLSFERSLIYAIVKRYLRQFFAITSDIYRKETVILTDDNKMLTRLLCSINVK